MPKYAVKRYTTEVSYSELYTDDEEPCPEGDDHSIDTERLEELAEEIENRDWNYVSDYPNQRYEFLEIAP